MKPGMKIMMKRKKFSEKIKRYGVKTVSAFSDCLQSYSKTVKFVSV